MHGFWSTLPKPFFALAPLEDVTDAAFRRLIAKYGKPHVMFTEFTSADGLILAESGQKKLQAKLAYSESERPIVAQLFTAKPEYMEQAARLVAEKGFDGLDINMGCPVDEVVRQDCGAALIKNPKLARELIQAARRGAPHLPLSVKTRIGYYKDELDAWLPELLAEDLSAVTIHARTRKEMSAVPAHWDSISRAVRIRDAQTPETLIIGNGDVEDMADARKRAAESGCDGVMLGRAIFGNPWLFAERARPAGKEERLAVLAEHLALFNEVLSGIASYALMKKHFKAYVSGWDGAKELRVRLMETTTVAEARELIASEAI